MRRALIQVVKGFVIAFALLGMMIGTASLIAGYWLFGLPTLVLSVLAYAWAEDAFQQPIFWAVPGFWLIFSLVVGGGTKGEGLIFGLLPLLLLMVWVRRRAAEDAPDTNSSNS